MKIGILTFHFAPNYGAALQAWGLQTALQELGHEVIFVNYTPPYMRSRNSWFRGWGLRQGKNFGKVFVQRLKEIKRRESLAKFKNRHLNVSTTLRTRQELRVFCLELDAIVVGSDQVWNTRWMEKYNNHFDDTYFLGFLPELGGPLRIAYGSCFGTPDQPDRFLEAAKPLIKRFDAVAMRNEFGATIVSRLGVANIGLIVDPAFFLKKRLAPEPRKNVVVYAVSDNTASVCASLAKSASFIKNEPIVKLASEFYIDFKGMACESYSSLDPIEWMYKIANASFVCSESFHGVVFAIAGGAPFCAVSAGARSHRVTGLLSRYSLGNRHVVDAAATDIRPLVEMGDEYMSALNQHIDASITFLKEALEKNLE